MNPLRRRIQTAMQTRGGGAAAWTPASIAGLQLWLDASQITGLNDGDAVSTWTDASGNGYSATQGTASARPIYKTGILNSRPVVRFDAVDDTMSNGTFAVNQANTWFAVVRTTGGNGSYRFVFDAAAGSTRQALIYTVGTTKWTIYAGALADESSTTASSTWRSIQAIFNGASSSLIVGGTTTTVNPGTDNLANGYILGTGGGGTYIFGGDIAELGCYNSALSGANLSALQSYLNAKYGL